MEKIVEIFRMIFRNFITAIILSVFHIPGEDFEINQILTW